MHEKFSDQGAAFIDYKQLDRQNTWIAGIK